MIEVKEFINGLIYRPDVKKSIEERIASGYIIKSDMGSSVKWGMTCSDCPLTDFTKWGQCISGFTCDMVPYETDRCKHLVSTSNQLLSKENMKVAIMCKCGGKG